MFLSVVNVCINTNRQKRQISALETYEKGKKIDRYATNLRIKIKFNVANKVYSSSTILNVFSTMSYYNVFVGDEKYCGRLNGCI